MLDHDGLPADHVGRPVQQQRRRHSARQPAIDRLVLIIERIHHHHVRRDRAGRLVHVIIKRNVRMRIDDPRRHEFPTRVDHRDPGRRDTFSPTAAIFPSFT